ncbi:MAG: ribonuclease III [Pseudomonadota bacterium]
MNDEKSAEIGSLPEAAQSQPQQSESKQELRNRRPLHPSQPVPQPLGPEHYGDIEALLGYAFRDRTRLERALTHRSVHGSGLHQDYEQLEFLGDAVFDLAVSHLLLEKHPEASEGQLSKMRAALVKRESLASIARKLELGKFIKLSRGELASGAHDRPSILSDVVEAVLGAVYKEAGFDVARECVERLIGDGVITVTPRDPKTELQETLHANGNTSPVYKLECIEGPEHSPVFISVVEVEGELLGRGRGSTKKDSQQAAADQALCALRERAERAVALAAEALKAGASPTPPPAATETIVADLDQGDSTDEPER